MFLRVFSAKLEYDNVVFGLVCFVQYSHVWQIVAKTHNENKHVLMDCSMEKRLCLDTIKFQIAITSKTEHMVLGIVNMHLVRMLDFSDHHRIDILPLIYCVGELID